MNERVKRLLFIFSICLNIGFIVIAAFAMYQKENRKSKFRYFGRHSTSAVFEVVDLTRQQHQEVDQLIQLFRANMLSVSKAVAPLKADLFIGMAGDKPLSEEEAKAIISKMNAMQNQRGELIHQHLKALRQVLTEEQTQEVFTRFAEIQNRWSKKVKPTW
ncbi:MAG: Spy/CpxP family protein refolding chaperone [Proteobacteria bacterium]|nr:Spy/CpxP family protein refolding chaperone [Pseudomonadota bacterium]